METGSPLPFVAVGLERHSLSSSHPRWSNRDSHLFYSGTRGAGGAPKSVGTARALPMCNTNQC